MIQCYKKEVCKAVYGAHKYIHPQTKTNLSIAPIIYGDHVIEFMQIMQPLTWTTHMVFF